MPSNTQRVKPKVTGEQLGFIPQPVRPRVPGESADQYKGYTQRMQGHQARELAYQQGYDTSGMAWDGKQFNDVNNVHWWQNPAVMGPIIVGASSLGAGLLASPASAPAAVTGATAPEITLSTSPFSAALPSASGAASSAGAGAGASSMAGFGKFFSKGLDPTSLLMMGLSMFGGDEGQERRSFAGKSGADPIEALRQALAATNSLGQGLQSRGPTRLRSSYVQKGPAPVQIPGLPFQIGGGLGVDPALADPSLLESAAMPDLGGNNPFGPRTAEPRTQPRQRKPQENG